jgi:hypothetical protein
MRIRMVLAGALLAGGLTVVPAQIASAACGWIDPDCYAKLKVEKDAGRFGLGRVEVETVDLNDPTKFAQGVSKEQAAQWRRDYPHLYPRSAEQQQDWLVNLFKGGSSNPNWGQRARWREEAIARDAVKDTAVDTSNIGVTAGAGGRWCHPQDKTPPCG